MRGITYTFDRASIVSVHVVGRLIFSHKTWRPTDNVSLGDEEDSETGPRGPLYLRAPLRSEREGFSVLDEELIDGNLSRSGSTRLDPPTMCLYSQCPFRRRAQCGGHLVSCQGKSC